MVLFSQIVNLTDTYGALMIGTFVSAILLGGIYLQAYYYFVTYSDGPLLQITASSFFNRIKFDPVDLTPSAAAIDITIAGTLSYYLHKKRTGFKQTDKLINRLIKYTINNGALTR
ncbi:hypothetical protein CVT25_002033 [Psilocybe cyanescens]|uniref:DUF6534 domain-containing protein n=1 Tax=Psilocybe cyanescens TaxID=93625 RepID=A0A409X089_PSICY|nr:hypothetical protein CVT25_002033 [Psilocybe cyanescens]